jgi:molybdate transport system substrate-binding protein
MSLTLHGISSMATRQLLAELTASYQAATGVVVQIESVGGVDAAKRVLAGEARTTRFDLVVLASDAIAKLAAAERVLPASITPLVHSGVAVAVRAGEPLPDLGAEAAVQQAVRSARNLSYSTGPSGVALARLFERWGLADELAGRIVTPPPGVPVGSLVASGEVALGFQQLSELIHLPGITVVGPLPAEIQITTTFTAAQCSNSAQSRAEAVQAFLAWLASPATADAKRRQGMDPA